MKKYIVRAAARLETVMETDKPENAKELLECVLNEDCGISADISNISLQEVSVLPQRFKQDLYNKFTHRKG